MRRETGSTLIEVLVVMVIFMLGMLAMMQVFPGGINILRQTRDMTKATHLGDAELNVLKTRSDQLPDMILAVTPVYTASGVSLVADASRRPSELAPPVGTGIDANGNVIDASNNILGKWQTQSGANVWRRVIGEGGLIPAPREVGSAFGGLLILQFAPILYNTQTGFFEVYGNDMILEDGTPTGGTVQPYQFFATDLNQPDAAIQLPTDPTLTRHFRISFSGWVKPSSGAAYRKDIVTTTPITVNPDPTGAYANVPLGPLILAAGESLLTVDPNSMQVARLFEQVTTFTNDPYEYELLDPTLGVVLFNPAGYNYKVRQDEGNLVPLVGRVNYDVLDWRILHEDFRVPSPNQSQVNGQPDSSTYELEIGNLAILGNLGADFKPNPGFPVPQGSGNYAGGDFMLLDLATGGIFVKTWNGNTLYQLDKGRGIVTFLDENATDLATNGLQMELLLPGASSPIPVNAVGRSVRAMYQGAGEWSVQVMKAASVYRISNGPPAYGQYYVGASNSNLAAPGKATRIYFPWNDYGKKVIVDTVNYYAGTTLSQMQAQDFVIQTDPTDPFGYPFADLTAVDPAATSFDFTVNGYQVANVKGASVSVRVLWNPAFFNLTADPAENMRRFNTWMSSWRYSETQTYLQRSEN